LKSDISHLGSNLKSEKELVEQLKKKIESQSNESGDAIEAMNTELKESRDLNDDMNEIQGKLLH